MSFKGHSAAVVPDVEAAVAAADGHPPAAAGGHAPQPSASAAVAGMAGELPAKPWPYQIDAEALKAMNTVRGGR